MSDSGGSGSGLSFGGGRGQQSTGRVPPVGVVPPDVSENGFAGLVVGVEFEVPLLLDVVRCAEAFGRGVVPAVALAAHAPAVALAAHAGDDACGLQRLAVVASGLLAAAVGVVDEPRCRPPLTNGHSQRAEHQMAVDLLLRDPAEDAAAMQVDEDRKMKAGMPHPDVGDVAHPGLIRAAGMKSSGKEVWRNLELLIQVRFGNWTAPCAGHAAAAPHGTGRARAVASEAALVQLTLTAPAAVA